MVGFGARKLFDHDDGPKYLNTPETPIYKKSHVLYGIDQAKREIAKQNKAVIVEGYTDVMACHLAGVPTAVATCGTAFGDGHISVLRRLLLDSDAGTIVFTFDGDAAGQKAALRAFSDDHKFAARSMVAIGGDNMDPCELRLAKGDAAVRDLIADSERLINFALRTTVQGYDLDSAEGQAGALRAGARMVADIKQRDLRDRYVGFLARHVGVDTEEARAAVADALRHGGRRPDAGGRPGRPAAPSAVPNSRRALVEREALKLAVQHPQLAGPLFDAVDATPYGHPVHAAVREAIAAAGGAASAGGGPTWIEQVRSGCVDLAGQALVTELAVEPLRYDGDPDPRYVSITLASLQLPVIEERIKAVKSKLQRTNPVQHKDEYLSLFGEVASLEQHAQALREQATGGCDGTFRADPAKPPAGRGEAAVRGRRTPGRLGAGRRRAFGRRNCRRRLPGGHRPRAVAAGTPRPARLARDPQGHLVRPAADGDPGAAGPVRGRGAGRAGRRVRRRRAAGLPDRRPGRAAVPDPGPGDEERRVLHPPRAAERRRPGGGPAHPRPRRAALGAAVRRGHRGDRTGSRRGRRLPGPGPQRRRDRLTGAPTTRPDSARSVPGAGTERLSPGGPGRRSR
ncbi:hypothetical protein Athai_39960 [Actinocatenispora thailandica]|uniref:Toprim domain-containing protein n=1 Tax=Actinocatenispora thailandica TaxID=227318 RepID=A0A7R7DRH0_9ACTN|nr:hypothetical protein Athai_39960 [Actinocatenispora thailandica]